MTRRKGRCVQCFAFAFALIAFLWMGSALANLGPASQISAEAWMGLFSTLLFALVAGYAKGQERRITAVEHEQRQQQTQINLLSERVLREHPNRQETAEHRAYVEGRLNHIIERLDHLTR